MIFLSFKINSKTILNNKIIITRRAYKLVRVIRRQPAASFKSTIKGQSGNFEVVFSKI